MRFQLEGTPMTAVMRLVKNEAKDEVVRRNRSVQVTVPGLPENWPVGSSTDVEPGGEVEACCYWLENERWL